jgi:VanZ family protein
LSVPSTVHPGNPLAIPASRRRPRYGWLTLAYLAMLIYGSLTPLDFNPRCRDLPWLLHALSAWVLQPAWDLRLHNDYSSLGFNNALTDIAINVAIYAPLGLLLRLALVKRRWTGAAQVIGATLAAALVSWCIEGGQSLTLDRVASLKNGVSNTGGALIGALAAVRLRALGVAAIFAVYRWTAIPLHHLRGWVVRQRRRPALLLAVAAADLALLTWASHHGLSIEDTGAPSNWMPFARQFGRSYDVAAVQIARGLVVYVAAAALLSLWLISVEHRRSAGWLALCAAALAAAHEAARSAFARAPADTTGPVLALIGALIVVAAVFLLVDAMKLACRRRSPRPVEHERRRVPHRYPARSNPD